MYPGPLSPPITVGDHNVFPDETAAAVDLWNGQVGCQFLKFVGDGEADVEAFVDDGRIVRENANRAERNKANGCASDHLKCEYTVIGLHTKVGRKSLLHFDVPNKHCTKILIAIHEIGHAIGLDHATKGPMMYKVPTCEDWGHSPFVYRIDDASLEAARVAYCR